jgi:PAS domain S-box-containing protein
VSVSQLEISVGKNLTRSLREPCKQDRAGRVIAMDRELQPAGGTEAGAGQFELIFQHSPQGLAVHREGHLLFVNPAFMRLFGFPDREAALALVNVLDLVHPDDRSFAAGQLAARETGQVYLPHFEIRGRRRNGEAFWFDSHVTQVDWEGRPASLVAVSEITDRKRSEEAQRRSERLFSTIFDVSPDPISLTTLTEGRFVYVNDAYLRTWGWRREEVIGHTAEEIGFWLDSESRERMVAALRRDGFVRDLETKVCRPDGEVREFRYSVEVIHFENEDLVLGMGRDVTVISRAAEELRNSVAAAELANRAKSEFLANMSHELRTPLNAIIGFSEIIASEMFGPVGHAQYREYAADIFSSGKLLLAIVNDVLDLSRLENGKLDIRVEEIDAGEMIAACLRLVKSRAREAEVKLMTDLPDPAPRLRADPVRLKQVLLNLLTNAVKFTPARGVVTAGARATEDGGVALTVSDTGIGMDAAEVKVALQLFGQVATSATRTQQGIGLGLPLTKALVELHGGRLEIDSTPGQGTRVTAYLPAVPKLPEFKPNGFGLFIRSPMSGGPLSTPTTGAEVQG